jgi:hydrogenase maturation protease
MNKSDTDILLIGYGNPGRMDDGLGPALSAEIAARNIPGVTVESDYQLTVEDAYAVANHPTVIFADATTDEKVDSFSFKRLHPAQSGCSFSSHSVMPDELLTLSTTLFGANTRAFVLGIRGYQFNNFSETLSDEAKNNLRSAADFIEKAIVEKTFPEAI